ncbi:MAG: 50S ribosome-binding GTPase [Oscillospiraceae bacterium]|nr:50S ribosome-binding GTPase [Oscillospiraceae bacterium]
MIQVPESLLDTMEKHISQELSYKWSSICSRMNSKRKIRVANTGLVSSGKSSLFNVLIDSSDKTPRFATGAARVTKSQDIEKLTDTIDIVDTPGIDVNEEDTQVALNSILESDIIIMIHNIKLGMLNDAEYQWLKSVAGRMHGEQEKKARLMFVCSWIDERQGNSDYQSTVDETRHMVKEAVGCDIDFYEISVKRYLAGVEKGKEKMVKMSNIPEIKEAIIKKAEVYSAVADRLIAEQLFHLCKESKTELVIKKQLFKEKKKDIICRIKQKYDSLKNEWNSVYQMFKNQYSLVRNKKDEYNSI